MYMGVLPARVCNMSTPSALEGNRSPTRELRTAVGCHVGAGKALVR